MPKQKQRAKKGKLSMEDEEEENIPLRGNYDQSANYGAPFPIYAPSEGIKYRFLIQK